MTILLIANDKVGVVTEEERHLLELSNAQIGGILCGQLVEMVRRSKEERGRESERLKSSSSFATAPFFALQNLLGLSASAKQTAIDCM